MTVLLLLLLLQCGECLQIVTGGLLVATPHAVRYVVMQQTHCDPATLLPSLTAVFSCVFTSYHSASKSPKGLKVGRGTFPVFIDTEIDFPLSPPRGVSRDAVFDRTIESRVPPLADRWERDGAPFVEFLGTTFKRYYEWTTKYEMACDLWSCCCCCRVSTID